MVDGGSLENCCAERHRGFESLTLRKVTKKSVPSLLEHRLFCHFARPAAGGEGSRKAQPDEIPESEGSFPSYFPKVCRGVALSVRAAVTNYTFSGPRLFQVSFWGVDLEQNLLWKWLIIGCLCF